MCLCMQLFLFYYFQNNRFVTILFLAMLDWTLHVVIGTMSLPRHFVAQSNMHPLHAIKYHMHTYSIILYNIYKHSSIFQYIIVWIIWKDIQKSLATIRFYLNKLKLLTMSHILFPPKWPLWIFWKLSYTNTNVIFTTKNYVVSNKFYEMFCIVCNTKRSNSTQF